MIFIHKRIENIFFSLLILLGGLILVDASAETIKLTSEEQTWLKLNPNIKLIALQKQEPLFIRNANDKISGIIPDYFKLINTAIGQSIDFSYLKSGRNHEQSKQKGIYGVGSILKSKLHKDKYLLSDSYLETPFYVFALKKNRGQLKKPKDLKGKKVAVIHQHRAHIEYLQSIGEVDIIYADTPLEVMNKVISGEADAMMGYITYPYLINKKLIVNLDVAFIAKENVKVHIGVNSEYPILVKILNKAITTISEKQKVEIIARWTKLKEEISPNIQLSQKERKWLRDIKVLRFGIDANWSPIEFIDKKGKPQGMSVAYLKRIEKLLNIRTEFVSGHSWFDTLKQLENGELDLVPAVSQTSERIKKFNFTKSYLSIPINIFSAANVAYLGNINALHGKKIAVVKNYAIYAWLRRDYPELELIPAKNIKHALQLIARDEAFAFVGNLVATSYYIGQSGLSQIKIAGETPYKYELAMAIRKDWPLLPGILQKTIDVIPNRERVAIYNDWISIKYQYEFDSTILWQIIFGFIVVLLFIFIWIWGIYHQKKLTQAAHQRTKENEKHYRLLIESAGKDYLFFRYSPEGKILYISPSIVSFTGITIDNAIGQNWQDVFDGTDKVQHFVSETKAKLELGMTSQTVEIEYNHPNGTVHFADVVKRAVFDDVGDIIAIEGIVRDTTKQKLIARKLEESDRLWQGIQDASNEIVVVISIMGIIQLTNDILPEKLGLLSIDIIGENLFNFFPLDVVETRKKYLEQVVNTKNTVVFEDTHEGITFENTLYPVSDQNGEVEKIVLVSTDITIRKESEEELKIAKTTADTANRAKSTFLASMSHELRTPLNAILGYVQILLNDKSNSVQINKGLNIIQQGGLHLDTLINDILDFVKLEVRKIELQPEVVFITPFVDGIVSSILPSKKTDVTVSVEVEHVIASVAVMVDEKRLRQVLLNLLGNAVKFTARGNVRLKVVSCLENKNKDEVCLRFTVEDDGVGIEPEDIDKIFQSFVQLGTKRDVNEGIGLGLAISQQLVMLMNSELKVISELGKGSCFWFDINIPVVTKEKEFNRSDFVVPKGFKGNQKTLWVVDDNKDNCNVLQDMLENWGFKVITIAGSNEVIAMAQTEMLNPDMVLLDLIMPEMDGYATRTALRELAGFEKISIIAVSAYTKDEQQVMDSGFDGFIPKPIKQEQLIKVLGEQLNVVWKKETQKQVFHKNQYNFPSIEELNDLRKLVVLGKMFKVIEWANALEARVPEYKKFASHIKEMAEEIDEEGIMLFIT